jgi:GGDEF domain-containing protein
MVKRHGDVVQSEVDIRLAGQTARADAIMQLLDDYVGVLIDSVTGLVQRTFFFMRLTETLQGLYESVSGNTDALFKKYSRWGLLVGDLAFLNFFNSISHSFGNEVLAWLGKVLTTLFPHCWVGRLGGDEVGVFNPDYASDGYETGLAAMQEILAGEKLRRVDLGEATLGDVAELAKIHPLPDDRAIKFITQALFDIAMCRAQIAKYYARLEFLVRILRDSPELYANIIDHARKGAGGVSDAEVQGYLDRSNNGDDLTVELFLRALETKAASMRGDPYEEAVFRVAESVFLVTIEM